MDQHFLDLDLAPDFEGDAADPMDWERSAPAARSTRTLTNSPGCAPAPAPAPAAPLALRSNSRPPLRRVRTDAWSVPASASWARPSRALRKVARRAVDDDRGEPA